MPELPRWVSCTGADRLRVQSTSEGVVEIDQTCLGNIRIEFIDEDTVQSFDRDTARILARVFADFARTGKVTKFDLGSDTEVQDRMDEMEDGLTEMAANVGKLGERLGIVEGLLLVHARVVKERLEKVVGE